MKGHCDHCDHCTLISNPTFLTFVCSIYRAEVMELLIQSSDLFVMQVEMDVYTALKKVRGRVLCCQLVCAHCTITLVSYLSLCLVDVSADQPVLGRPHQAASG